MEILSVLEALEDLVEKSMAVPFTGKCMVIRDEILDIIQDIRLKLPDELKQANWVIEERTRILAEAQQEADNIIKSSDSRIAAMVDEHEISRKAYEQAEVIITNAKKNAREIRLGTREYADNILNKVEEILEDTLDVIKVNRDELK
ncbi:MAG: ATPase, partial [Ruminiclostridium sp.]|nr:ATPase [Ruminiclostridium sp.]